MAAFVAGLARVLQPTMTLLGGERRCQGLDPWYLLLGLRLVALFIADGPWSSVQPDLACNWTLADLNVRPFCSTLCFNQHFSSGVSSAWGFAFLVALLPVGLMRLIRSGVKHERQVARAADEELTDSIGMRHNMESGIKIAAGSASTSGVAAFKTDPIPTESKMAPRCTWRSVAFAFCVILFMAIELCFFWVVITLQMPSVSETTFLCLPGAQTCPEALECAMGRQADKQVALWALAFTAMVDVVACLVYLFLRLMRVSQCHRK
ncbi:hypothetical protein JD844_001351 [Phrynosoma platyrhinos]|uniref:Connexin N-terminal domain-containing protein n=1 Tax=Phrynosoma platyrhinos TaxID=52577 RepID=A0ABQ7TB18_PHRPL|nr:hypothetical protein JD844_001351 [Phrynosoma platyrhinos]